MTDKIGVLDPSWSGADTILIGGAMCFPFFKAQGHDVGASLCEEEGIEPAAPRAGRPTTTSCALPATSCSARVRRRHGARELDGVDVPDGWMGLDVGPPHRRALRRDRRAGTVFWNGPMGAFELEPFAAGTRAVAEAVARRPATTVVGGGDWPRRSPSSAWSTA